MSGHTIILIGNILIECSIIVFNSIIKLALFTLDYMHAGVYHAHEYVSFAENRNVQSCMNIT
jgi:hypothetical protein